MKKFSMLIVLCILFSGFAALYSQAQEAEIPKSFVVFEEFVIPADMPAYTKAQNKVLELWDKHSVEVPLYTYRNDENAFYWVVSVENFAGMDALYETMMGAWKKMKEEDGFDVSVEFRDLSTGRQTMLRLEQDLSYHPSGQFGQIAEKPFCEWTFIYLKAGHEKEAAEAIKKYQAFYDSIDETYEWDLYSVMMGHDTPCWILMTRDKSELALRKIESEQSEKYGEDFKKMWANFAQHVRKFENKKGWFLPKWSRNWEMD